MKNIVLIGMPGSGKTTISQALSLKTGWPVIDLDTYLTQKYQQSIPEMFAISESYFRDKETAVCHDLKTREGTILACGGGVVLREENIKALKENGIVCLLERDLEKIMQDVDTQSRPLLKEGKERLRFLYKQRRLLYKKSADVIIDNNSTIEYTLSQIEKYMQ